MKAISILLLVAACAGSQSERERFVDRAQGYSLDEPAGWVRSTARGAARFEPKVGGKHTIVVRSAPKPALSDEALVATTKRVLAALPDAHVDAPVDIDAKLTAFRFTLTFVHDRATYRRAHYVLIGARHLFHVFCTVPDGEPLDDDAISELVKTFEEET